jgi:hypothetical protein
MGKNYKYPSTYEIEEVLGNITNRGFLNDLAQRKGIFVTNGSQKQLASDLANLFYEDDELESIRMEAYSNNATHTLSGFLVRSSEKKFNLKNIYEYIRENAKFEMGQTLSQLTKVSGTDDQPTYRGTIEYFKPRAGRMEFIQDETTSFEFYINHKKEGVWQVEVDASRSNDVKELKNILSKDLPKEVTLDLIDQSFLTTENTISFFDTLAKKGMSSEWSFMDTMHLTLRRGSDDRTEKDSSIEDDHEIKEVTETAELAGITQAILQGKGLRENIFVKQSVENGYQFTAMTYEFQHKTKPLFIQVKAEFKGKPKVFEVGIVSYEEHVGIPPRREVAILSATENRLIRSSFWNNAKEIYDSMPKRKN